ncbi:hypothetical protein JKP88DRAFT_274835 [Tribonema minus]|uniref:Uncharacterized protein n=1 Tax=Tribonema minus TaxID=303371 RepID=A0A835ZCI1_9STRA|nr:hypothetical protein JKP88DRAFT_274835 [Tribonema minus]
MADWSAVMVDMSDKMNEVTEQKFEEFKTHMFAEIDSLTDTVAEAVEHTSDQLPRRVYSTKEAEAIGKERRAMT